MPLYEYQCQKCENRFERIEKASSLHDGICPSCGGAASRLLGAPALKFKGSGWYVTDYGKGNGDRPSTSEKMAEASSESTGSAKNSNSSNKAETNTSTSKTDSKVA